MTAAQFQNKKQIGIYFLVISLPLSVGVFFGIEYGTKYLILICAMLTGFFVFVWRYTLKKNLMSTFTLLIVSVVSSIVAYIIDWKVGELLSDIILN